MKGTEQKRGPATASTVRAFFIPGDPVGYTKTRPPGRHGRRFTMSPRWARYLEYKKTIQLLARAEGFRVPLEASENAPVRVDTHAVFRTRVHPDPENVRKGVVDALFYQAKGGDKWVKGTHDWPEYGPDPGVLVMITFYERRGGEVVEVR